MNDTDGLLPSFDRSWKDFSGAWKKARAKASEKPIHDLRVNTRRLIATMELAKALSSHSELAKLQRRFKKVLKRMGPLRDVQVQLENVARMRQIGLVADFKKTLERRERRQIDNIRGELKRGRKQQLTKGVKDVRSEFKRFYKSLGQEKIRRSIDRVLTLRATEFLKAERRFHRLLPVNEEALHQMRIALKKLRYAVEAAQPVTSAGVKQRPKEMQAFQQLMGDTRDIELLRAELEKWATKRGKTIAIVPVLNRLHEKRESLLKKILESSKRLENSLKAEAAKPVVEKTQAVGVAAAVPVQSDRRAVAAG